MKLAIIGAAGTNGSTAAYALAMRDVVDEIKLIDVNENAVMNHAMDMSQAVLDYSSTKISVANYEDIGDCDVVLIAANKSTKQVKDRNERLAGNASLFIPITNDLKKYAKKDAIYIVVANPVDVFTYVTYKLLGCKPGQVIGFSLNDTTRLKWAISIVKELDYRKLNVYCLGEHGVHQVRLLDQITYDGKKIELTQEETQNVLQLTSEWFPKFQALGQKRTTGWISGTNLAEVMANIFTDSKKKIPCSAVLTGESGYENVSVGSLCTLGKNGIEKVELPLNEEEKIEMDAAVESIKNLIDSELIQDLFK